MRDYRRPKDVLCDVAWSATKARELRADLAVVERIGAAPRRAAELRAELETVERELAQLHAEFDRALQADRARGRRSGARQRAKKGERTMEPSVAQIEAKIEALQARLRELARDKPEKFADKNRRTLLAGAVDRLALELESFGGRTDNGEQVAAGMNALLRKRFDAKRGRGEASNG